MRTSTICATLMVSMWLGCGGPEAGSTPRETFEAYQTARGRSDFAAVWELLSSASQERMERDAKDLAEEARIARGPAKTAVEAQANRMDMTVEELERMTGREYFIGLGQYSMGTEESEKLQEELSRAKFDREDILEERARVYATLDGKPWEEPPTVMVLEDGRWKLDLTGIR